MDWLLLIASQPTGNSAVRMRVWREVKARGAAILRDGVYLLPQTDATRAAFESLAAAVLAAGGQAQVIEAAEPPGVEPGWPRLFDRSSEYAELLARIEALARGANKRAVDALRSELREAEAAVLAVVEVDYFGGPAQAQVMQALSDLRGRIERRAAPGEPHAARGAIERHDPADFRGRAWATRRDLWVDRVASAWLIRRFIDPQARFVWIKQPADKPKRAIGFDYDGADFTHRNGRVTFEVLRGSFDLDADAGLTRLGSIVHVLDVGGVPLPEAPGMESLLAGLKRVHGDDDAFLAAASTAFEGWYAAFSAGAEPDRKKT
ncbi:MAG TPA: chromate resistance protein ChrB domain-containing protein [Burkholderiaceae bacterium]|nr:chromate resistance protein ChrB domain-containing protein [Burkholderiaceae bacterium]